MLVNMNEVLYHAKKKKSAVGLFNAVNLELARGILSAAEKTGSPVIIGTAEILLPYGPLEELSYFLIPMAKAASVPVVVHLDHGLKEETCLKALELGFTSVMYDCSTDDYETNMEKVKNMAKIAHSHGATIEGELGHVGNNEKSMEKNPDEIVTEEMQPDPSLFYTDPLQAKEFVKETQVDALAIAVGTAHGAYRLPPKLDFGRIETIAKAVDVPLVLHGGSGLSDEDFRKAISAGISKINIFTDIDRAGAKAAKNCLNVNEDSLINSIPDTVSEIEKEVMKKMLLFRNGN